MDRANPIPLYRLGDACRRQGDVAGWRRAVSKAFECPHITHEQLYLRSRAKLTLDDWSGWVDYESRYFGPMFYTHRSSYAWEAHWTHQAWDGAENIREHTLLLIHEQGFGDMIQMMRFVPLLTTQANEVVLVVRPHLLSLVQHNFAHLGNLTVLDVLATVEYDRYAWTMSLPGFAGYLPPFTPISAPNRGKRLGARQRPVRAGICWAGDPQHPRDIARSMPVTSIVSLLRRPDTEWYSLQVGERASEASALDMVIKPAPALVTFADTADLVAELDFVVSVDTAVCHLAGSLGVRTYLMLPACATWRWGLGERTPWYPSVRLIRQHSAGDWDSAVESLLRLLNDEF